MLTQPQARSDSAPSPPDDGSPSAGEPDAPVTSRAAQRVIDDLFGPASGATYLACATGTEPPRSPLSRLPSRS
jgi:hypothetical protein